MLSSEDLAKLNATIDALPPLTDEELDAVADVLLAIRLGGDADA